MITLELTLEELTELLVWGDSVASPDSSELEKRLLARLGDLLEYALDNR